MPRPRRARPSASATCARPSAASSSPSRTPEGPGHRGPRQPRRPAVARPHLPQGASRSPTSTPTPTGCAGRCGRTATRWVGDRLGRGARPGRRQASPGHQHPRPGRPRDLPRQPQRPQPRLGTRTGSTLVKALRSRNTFSATSVDQLPPPLLAQLMFGHQRCARSALVHQQRCRDRVQRSERVTRDPSLVSVGPLRDPHAYPHTPVGGRRLLRARYTSGNPSSVSVCSRPMWLARREGSAQIDANGAGSRSASGCARSRVARL